MIFHKYKCPKCGKKWSEIGDQCECGYQFHAIGCPECMRVIGDPLPKQIKNCVIQKEPDKYLSCECLCNYEILGVTLSEYRRLREPIKKLSSESIGIPRKYREFLINQAELPVQKYMYDNVFDHSKINMNHWRVISFFAFLSPELEDSKNYFLSEYGESYDELCRKTNGAEALQALRDIEAQSQQRVKELVAAHREAIRPTPKCPICGSTRLTKISTLTKAAKISAFGIYGAGDIGKTYKCNNCGVKF